MPSMDEAWEAVKRLRRMKDGYSLEIHTDAYVDLAPPVIVMIRDTKQKEVFHRETVYGAVPDVLMEAVRLFEDAEVTKSQKCDPREE